MLFVSLATAAAALLYLANFHPHRVPFRLPAFFGEVPPARHTHGGTPLGLIFGSVAFAIFLGVSMLGIRKKQRVWPIGNVRLWLKVHIWLSTLTLPLVLFHCGFRLGGAHTMGLMILYFVVMGSGFFGLALQQFMPRLMKERLPREVVFEQIPHMRGVLFEAAAKVRQDIRELEKSAERMLEPAAVAAGTSEPEMTADSAAPDLPSLRALGQFLDTECLPYLAAKRGHRQRLGDARTAAGFFRMLRANVAAQWQPKVGDFERWCDERRTMDLQTRYQHWLHGWLVIHVPLSFGLLVFTAWHAWVAVHFIEIPR